MSNCGHIIHLIREDEEQNRLIIVEMEEDLDGMPFRREPICAAENLTQAELLIECRMIELGCSFSYAKLCAQKSVGEHINQCKRFKAEVESDLADNAAMDSPDAYAH